MQIAVVITKRSLDGPSLMNIHMTSRKLNKLQSAMLEGTRVSCVCEPLSCMILFLRFPNFTRRALRTSKTSKRNTEGRAIECVLVYVYEKAFWLVFTLWIAEIG